MNDARMPLPGGNRRLRNQLLSIAHRLETGSIQTGDNIHHGDVDVLRSIGHSSVIIDDGAKLLRLIQEKLAHLTDLD